MVVGLWYQAQTNLTSHKPKASLSNRTLLRERYPLAFPLVLCCVVLNQPNQSDAGGSRIVFSFHSISQYSNFLSLSLSLSLSFSLSQIFILFLLFFYSKHNAISNPMKPCRDLYYSLSLSGTQLFPFFDNYWWCPFRPFCLFWLKFESFSIGVDFFLYVSLYAMCFWCLEAILLNGFFNHFDEKLLWWLLRYCVS